MALRTAGGRSEVFSDIGFDMALDSSSALRFFGIVRGRNGAVEGCWRKTPPVNSYPVAKGGWETGQALHSLLHSCNLGFLS